MMKQIIMISGLISALFAGDLFPSQAAASSSSSDAITADANVYFTTPDNRDGVSRKRESFLNAAIGRVLVAAYWITDDAFTDHLIDLKKRGIDVQVIFDLSTKNAEVLMNKFILNNIVPIISPDTGGAGIMHNKFLVVDGKDVLTGSANFTIPAFRPTAQYWNDENIVTLRSPAIAKKYEDDFFAIESRIFDTYIQQCANAPGWMNTLVSELYKKNDRFKNRVRTMFDQVGIVEKNYLKTCFPDLMPAQSAAQASMPSSARPISATQIAELNRRGINPAGLTYDGAYALIGQIRQQGLMPAQSAAQASMPSSTRPISAWQVTKLRDNGINPAGLTYDDAYALIADILQEDKMQQEAEGSGQQYKKRKR